MIPNRRHPTITIVWHVDIPGTPIFQIPAPRRIYFRCHVMHIVCCLNPQINATVIPGGIVLTRDIRACVCRSWRLRASIKNVRGPWVFNEPRLCFHSVEIPQSTRPCLGREIRQIAINDYRHISYGTSIVEPSWAPTTEEEPRRHITVNEASAMKCLALLPNGKIFKRNLLPKVV